ncbi:MFS general substrate transporter, partial [Fistulina hepatica ATCC 64428]
VVPLTIGIFLAAMDTTIVLSSYATIGSDMNQLQNTSWIATGYMLTSTSFQALYGKLSDIFGRKSCLLFAYTVFAIGCLLCGISRNLTELVASRALAGAGGGGMTTIVSIIVSDLVPLRSRGTWQGMLNIIYATGAATGAPLGGILTDSIGWRWAFLIQVPASVLAIICVAVLLRLPKTDKSHFKEKLKRVDFSGAITLVLFIFFLLLGLDRGGNVAWSDKWTLITLGVFVVSFVLFCWIEHIATEPFAPHRVIANPALFACLASNFFEFFAVTSVLFQVSLYFQAVRGATAAQAGMFLLPSIFAGVLGSLGGGLVMQASGRYYWLTLSSFIALTGGMIVLAMFTGTVSHSMVGLSVALITLSLGNGSGVTTTLIALIANAGKADQALATAASYLFRSLGQVCGLAVSSTVTQGILRGTLREKLASSGLDVDAIVSRVRESLAYLDELDAHTRSIVRSSYEDALSKTFWFLAIAATATIVTSAYIREKPLEAR